MYFKRVYVKYLFDLNVAVNIPPKMGRVCSFLLSIENGPSLKVGRDWCILKMGRVRKWAESESGPRWLEIFYTIQFSTPLIPSRGINRLTIYHQIVNIIRHFYSVTQSENDKYVWFQDFTVMLGFYIKLFYLYTPMLGIWGTFSYFMFTR